MFCWSLDGWIDHGHAADTFVISVCRHTKVALIVSVDDQLLHVCTHKRHFIHGMCTSRPAALDLVCCLVIFGVTQSSASGEYCQYHPPHMQQRFFILLSLTRGADFVYQAGELQPWLYSVFSQLHQTPELSFEETATSSLVQLQLQQHNIAFVAPVAKTGIIASVGHGSPVVYLRADMDALPISEEMSHLLR